MCGIKTTKTFMPNEIKQQQKHKKHQKLCSKYSKFYCCYQLRNCLLFLFVYVCFLLRVIHSQIGKWGEKTRNREKQIFFRKVWFRFWFSIKLHHQLFANMGIVFLDTNKNILLFLVNWFSENLHSTKWEKTEYYQTIICFTWFYHFQYANV